MNTRIRRGVKHGLARVFAVQPLISLLQKVDMVYREANLQRYRRHLVETSPLEIFIHADWARIPMYSAIHRFLTALSKEEQLAGKIAVEVGGSEGSIQSMFQSLGVKYIVAEDFPRVDVHRLPYEDESFDFIVLDQILEHIEKPWVAVDEIFRVLKPGGISIVASPFMLAYHAHPAWKDYWRFTPAAWEVLFSKFQILEADGWGSAEAIRASWEYYETGPTGCLVPLEECINKGLLKINDRTNFIQTWCIARKPK